VTKGKSSHLQPYTCPPNNHYILSRALPDDSPPSIAYFASDYIMVDSTEPPVPALEVRSSSSLSDPPSIIIPPYIDSSSLSSVPDTPSRPSYELGDAHASAGDSSGTVDDESDPTNLPLSREEKLNAIVDALRRTRWSFEDMIEAWVGYSGQPDVRVQHRWYHKQKQRRSALTRAMRTLAESGICQDIPLDTRCASELDVSSVFSRSRSGRWTCL
jgi:hypothetical protein